MLPKVKTLLIFTVALWGFISAYKNLSDWEGTIIAVHAATSMSTIEEGATNALATTNSFLIWTGAILILLSKLATGILCAMGALKMWKAQSKDLSSFNAAKEMALTGCAVAILMLFGGFVVIAEGWFELWRSESMRAPVLDSVFRYAGMIMLIALFVAIKDE